MKAGTSKGIETALMEVDKVLAGFHPSQDHQTREVFSIPNHTMLRNHGITSSEPKPPIHQCISALMPSPQ